MLTWLRSTSGSILVKLLLGLLVLSFAVWGISGQIFSGVGNHVVQVGDTRVSTNEYRLAYDRQIQMMSQQFGTRITREQARAFGLEQQVLAQLVAGAVLDEQAREMRLGLSRDRVAALTAEDEAFRGAGGTFDRNQFEFVLQQVGMRPEDYLRNLEQVAIRQQIVDAVADGMSAPDTFLRAAAMHRGEDRTVEYVELRAALVGSVADPADDVLAAWFEENAASYAAPEYRRISYVKLEPEDIADASAPTAEDVQVYYDTHQASFTQAEQRTIRQLVFPSAEAAEDAASRIDSGSASFDEVAEELGRTPDDTILGTFAAADVPDPEIGEAAFQLQEGETSGVVQGTFGPVLVNVAGIEDGSVRDLASVEDDIRQELAIDEANRVLLDVYDAYEDGRASGLGMAEAAEQQGLEVVTTDQIDASGMLEDGSALGDIPASEELLAAAFDTDQGIENAPLTLGSNGYLFYEVEEVTPARDRPLEEVRADVVADWKTSETRRLLAERAEEIAESVRNGSALAETAGEADLDVQTKRGLRRGADDADLGRQGVAAAFAVGPQGVTTVASQNGDIQKVLQVTEIFAPANASPDAIPDATRESLAGSFADDLLEQLVTRLQGNYEVSVNQTAVQQALSF